MTEITQVQIHFVKGLINHRLRFGQPTKVIKLDRYRRLATFPMHEIFGYIRWRANEYGTQDWRVYILKTQPNGLVSQVPGILPAVKILVSAEGAASVKRALKAIDQCEEQAKDGLCSIPESYWARLNTSLMLKKPTRDLPFIYRETGVSHAQ